MKKLITNYTFSPAVSGSTVTLNDFTSVDIRGLLLITNVTSNVAIYSFADPTLGGTASGNIITLVYNTFSMASTDNLQIFYEDGRTDYPLSNADLRSQDVSVIDVNVDEAFKSHTEFGDDLETPSFFDMFDPNNSSFIPFVMAPAGIDYTGQQPSTVSFPVTLSNENILDKYILSFGFGPAVPIGYNILSPNPLPSTTWIDCQQYRSIYVQLNQGAGISAGVITFEGSNDGVNAVAQQMYDLNAPATLPVSTYTCAASVYKFYGAPLNFRYYRWRVSTAIAGGIISTSTMLRMSPFSAVQLYVNDNIAAVGGTGTVATASTGGGFTIGGNVAPDGAVTMAPGPVGGHQNTGQVSTVGWSGATTNVIPPTTTIAAGLTKRFLMDGVGSIGITTPISLRDVQAQLSNPVTVTGTRKGTIKGQYDPVLTLTDTNTFLDANEAEGNALDDKCWSIF